MLRNLSWSKVFTEQGHSAASVVKKHRTRSMFGQMRSLFAELDEVRTLHKCRKVFTVRKTEDPLPPAVTRLFLSWFPIELPPFRCRGQKRVFGRSLGGVSRQSARWRTLSSAHKSVVKSRAATKTREKIGNMQRNFLKPVTRFITSKQLLKSRPTELTCPVGLATAGFLRRRPLLSMRCRILTTSAASNTRPSST